MRELRAMKGMIEERFGALAFMEKLQRQPVQARLTQRLLEVGFSPALVRKLVDGCPTEFATGDENIWASHVLAATSPLMKARRHWKSRAACSR